MWRKNGDGYEKKVGRQWYVTRLKTKYTDINDRLYLLENLQYYGYLETVP